MEEIIAFLAANWFAYIVIPILIFLARITDVSMGTLRIIFVSKGMRLPAPLIGFFEVLIWLLAIQQIIGNLTNAFSYIAYAGGFAVGTYVGLRLDERLSFGKVSITIITDKDAKRLLKNLKDAKYTVTTMGADGPKGGVRLLMTVLDRRDVKKVINMVKTYNKDAFYSIQDVRYARDNFITEPQFRKRKFLRMFKKTR